MALTVAELLVKVGLLDDRQQHTALSRASDRAAGGAVLQKIAELGYSTEANIARVLSVELGLPRVELAVTPPEPDAINLLDGRTCLERWVLPLALREGGELLWLAMADPTDTEALALVRRKAQKRVRPAVAGASEIAREARRIYAMPGRPESSTSRTNPSLSAIELDLGGSDERFEVVNVADDSASPLQRIARQLGLTTVPEDLPLRSRAPVTDERAIEVDLDTPAEGNLKVEHQSVRDLPRPGVLTMLPPDAPSLRPRPPAATRPAAQTEANQASAWPPIPSPPQAAAESPAPAAPPQSSAPQAAALQTPPPKTPPSPTLPPMAPEDDPFWLPPRASGTVRMDLTPQDMDSLAALRASMEKGALVLRALAELCVEKGLFTREEMKRKGRG